jgi:hypothetical protein
MHSVNIADLNNLARYLEQAKAGKEDLWSAAEFAAFSLVPQTLPDHLDHAAGSIQNPFAPPRR